MTTLDKNGCGDTELCDCYCYGCNPNDNKGRMTYTGRKTAVSSKYDGKSGYWYKCVICNYEMDYDKPYIHEWRIR